MQLLPLFADMAEVIERRKHRKGGQYDYYIHYLDRECSSIFLLLPQI